MFNGSLLAICVYILSALTTFAQGGQEVLVDQGNNYSSDGQSWPGDTDYAPPGTTGGTVPFALNFGSGAALRSFTFDPHGQVPFTGTDFIAPLRAAIPFRVDNSGFSFMRWGAGLIDPKLLAPPPLVGPFDISNALQAYRFTWLSVCPTGGVCDGSNSVSFQTVLVNLGSDAFVLEFNYGLNSFVPPGATAGYLLGANTASFAGPFNDVGPDYCFKGGVASAFTTVAACRGAVTVVPEPATIALFLTGFTLLAGTSLRRRRSPFTKLPG